MEIKYEIRETNEFGKGIFSNENIKKGALIWSYKINENVFEYNEQQSIAHLTSLPTLTAQQQFLDYVFGKGELLCLITDDNLYMNHASAPDCNCLTDIISGNCYAMRDIIEGEQLYEDYVSFSHPPFLYALLEKYQCKPTYYELPLQ